jgi:uncharacterized phage-associated protein
MSINSTENSMVDINQVADYICDYLVETGAPPSQLKLHKLLYYVQAWNLALYDEPLFGEEFQAWVHGPVSRVIYDRFKSTKNMLSTIDRKDIPRCSDLPENVTYHIGEVLEAYGDFSGTQLEELTHKEDPWLNARKGLERSERSTNAISKEDMKVFYKLRLS